MSNGYKFNIGDIVFSKNNLEEELTITGHAGLAEESTQNDNYYRAGRDGMICHYWESELVGKEPKFKKGDIVKYASSVFHGDKEYVVEKPYGKNEPYYKLENSGLLAWEYELVLVKRPSSQKMMKAKKSRSQLPTGLKLFFPESGVMFHLSILDTLRLLESDKTSLFMQFNVKTGMREFVFAIEGKDYCVIGNMDFSEIDGYFSPDFDFLSVHYLDFYGKNLAL